MLLLLTIAAPHTDRSTHPTHGIDILTVTEVSKMKSDIVFLESYLLSQCQFSGAIPTLWNGWKNNRISNLWNKTLHTWMDSTTTRLCTLSMKVVTSQDVQQLIAEERDLVKEASDISLNFLSFTFCFAFTERKFLRVENGIMFWIHCVKINIIFKRPDSNARHFGNIL